VDGGLVSRFSRVSYAKGPSEGVHAHHNRLICFQCPGFDLAKALFVCVGLVGRNDSEPDCFYNLYKL
jgi:hypothetical protein